MALEVLLNSDTKSAPKLELVRDGDDINLELNGILVAYFDDYGVLQLVYPTTEELTELEEAGFSLEDEHIKMEF